jgi:hypothetical protein
MFFMDIEIYLVRAMIEYNLDKFHEISDGVNAWIWPYFMITKSLDKRRG